tara:strand:- start:22705 stop:22836 length:132 start_codon:yes stop_codon:yes gene_type:complete
VFKGMRCKTSALPEAVKLVNFGYHMCHWNDGKANSKEISQKTY